MLELQASSSPPPPTTAAPAPAARSTPRRLHPAVLAGRIRLPSLVTHVPSISFEVAPRRGTAYEVTPDVPRVRGGAASEANTT